MKDAQFELEFTSHVLANGINEHEQVDTFKRDGSNNLIFQPSWWHAALTKAIEFSRLRGIKANDINLDVVVTAETQLYKRKYGENNYRVHEAIMPGTIVTFNALVADQVTESVFKSLLDKMGTYVGLSPYGYNLGYGKFKVKRLSISPSDA